MIDNWNFLVAGLASAPGLVLSGSLLTLGLVVLRNRVNQRRLSLSNRDLAASLTLDAIRELAIFRISRNGRLESWSPAAETLFSRSADAALGKSLADLIGEAPSGDILKIASESGHHSTVIAYQGQRQLHLSVDRILDGIGRNVGFAVTVRDVTADQVHGTQTEALYAKGHLALENLPLGIALLGADEQLLFSNPAFRQITRVPQALAEAKPHFRETLFFALGRLLQPRDELEADVAELYRRYRENLIRPGGGALVETFGEDRTIQIRTTVLEEGGFVVVLEDISRHLQSERSLAYAARHDAVTGLPNHAEYEDYLEDALAHARRKALRLSALTVDLSRFRTETMRFGTEASDMLLRRFSARLTASLIQGEFIARTDRDRLTILKAHAQPAELDGLIKRLRHVLGERFDHHGEPLSIPVRLDLRALDTRVAAADAELEQAVSALHQAARSLAASPSEGASPESQSSPPERAVS